MERKRRGFASPVVRAVAALVVAGTLGGGSWLTHVDVWPSSATLRCIDVDPFRCHASASEAVAFFNRERPGPIFFVRLNQWQWTYVRVQGHRQLFGLGHEVMSIPATVLMYLNSLGQATDLVTLTTADSTGGVRIGVAHCRGGHDYVALVPDSGSARAPSRTKCEPAT